MVKKIILIGDSTRMGYDKYVKDALGGSAEVYYAPENGRNSTNVLRFAHDWKRKYEWPTDADIVLWNAGLWDLLELFGDGPLVPLSHYRDNVPRIDKRLRMLFPNAKIASSSKAFAMMNNFFGTDFKEKQIVVGEGDVLSLGERSLTFITAPMVHWPEVVVSYDSRDKILFSADGFGRFGACDGDDWADEARRYYIGIVGKYGAQVQALLKKAAALDIAMICPLHGPVIKENLSYYISLYDKWSRYEPEEDGIVIAAASIYGNTLEAAKLLRDEIAALGYEKVVLYDLARCDMAKATADAFRYSKLVLASATYNADVFPFMREYINHLTERGFKNRTVALIENGSWAPMAAKTMRAMLDGAKEITYAETTVKILSALNEDSKAAIRALAEELIK